MVAFLFESEIHRDRNPNTYSPFTLLSRQKAGFTDCLYSCFIQPSVWDTF